jgi:hypothetical protein
MSIQIVSTETAKALNPKHYLPGGYTARYAIRDGALIASLDSIGHVQAQPVDIRGIGRTDREALLALADALQRQADAIRNEEIVVELAPAATDEPEKNGDDAGHES